MSMHKRFKEHHHTLRFCLDCKKNTWYVYNPNLGHSECKECGSRLGRRPEMV